MDLKPLIPLGLLALGAAAIYGLSKLMGWMERRGWVDLSPQKARRGAGGAMLGLQAFIDPGAEHVIAVENREQKEEDGDIGGDEPDPDAIRADLSDALGRTPIDPDEIRRHLTSAQRAGLDWRALYDDALRSELSARPYRAPSMPPVARVAPLE